MSETSEVTPNNIQRRVGIVVRWLRNGYGFVTDLGRMDTLNNSGYGWIADENTGAAIFVYHSGLDCKNPEAFHRLFANEYIEYSADFSLPQRDGRTQGFDVRAIAGQKLQCDLLAERSNTEHQSEPKSERGLEPKSERGQQRHRQREPEEQHRPRQSRSVDRRRNRDSQQPTTVQYIYYVPTNGASGNGPSVPAGLNFPPLPHAASNSEPAYVMPTNGIPVPK